MTISINQSHVDGEGSLKEPSTIIGGWWSSMEKSYLLHSSLLLALDWMGKQIIKGALLQIILDSIIKLIGEFQRSCIRLTMRETFFFNLSKENRKWKVFEIFQKFLINSIVSLQNPMQILSPDGERWSKKYFLFYSSDKISSARARTWNWNGAILLRNQKIRFTHE